MPMVLPPTCFSEGAYFFFRNLTSSATVKQSTIKISAVLLIFENENGIVLICIFKVLHFYTNTSSILLNPASAARFSHKI